MPELDPRTWARVGRLPPCHVPTSCVPLTGPGSILRLGTLDTGGTVDWTLEHAALDLLLATQKMTLAIFATTSGIPAGGH